jgi:alkylmercury lyase
VRVEVLYFDGCPGHEALLERLRELMAGAGVDEPVELAHIASAEEARRERFLGSPTLRIDGRDVEPAAAEREDYGLKCRLYATAGGLTGAIPDELITAALSAGRSGDDDHGAALQATFPAADDAALALALLRLLAAGKPVSAAALADAAGRDIDAVARRLDDWPNVKRDAAGAVVAFAGLSLQATAHAFDINGRRLHTWCAWDTLFLPALLQATASVRSRCAVSGAPVELVVSGERVEHAAPPELYVTFPPLSATHARDITGTFCCHVHFLAGAPARDDWAAGHPGGRVLELGDAFAVGRRAVAPLLDHSTSEVSCPSCR